MAATKRETLIKDVINNLAFYIKAIKLENCDGYFDSNRSAQLFFKGLFKILFNFEDLVDLDIQHDILSFPAVDLGDSTAGIAIQVTSQTDRGKINSTIKVFLKKKLYETYPRLVLYILGRKGNYGKPFDTNGKFEFNKDSDIWDDDRIAKEIAKIEDTQTLEELDKFLRTELDSYRMLDSFSESDIKSCIGLLKNQLSASEKAESWPAINRTDEDYILKKNVLNGISEEFFKQKILGHIQYGPKFSQFLSREINADIRKDYFAICKKIREIYELKPDTFNSIPDLLTHIFKSVVDLYGNDTQIPNLYNKLAITLHTMYFNCDIGINP